MTQCERILRHLQDYGSITQAEAVTEYGCYRLGARIWDLKLRAYLSRAKLSPGRTGTGSGRALRGTPSLKRIR